MLISEEIKLNPVQSMPEFAGILKNQTQFAGDEPEDAAGKMNGWFDQLLIQSGLETDPATILMLCMMSFVGLGGLVFVIQEDLLSAALCAALTACLMISMCSSLSTVGDSPVVPTGTIPSMPASAPKPP